MISSGAIQERPRMVPPFDFLSCDIKRDEHVLATGVLH